MIWLSLKLGLGQRVSALSAAALAVAIALGLAASLASFGYANGITSRSDRGAWTEPITATLLGLNSERLPGVSYVNFRQDYFQGSPVTVVTLAAVDESAPVPPGLSTLPAPGEVYLSPALRALVDRAPVLAARYGEVVGTVGKPGLASPTTLLAVRGVPLDVAMLSGSPVKAFGTFAPPIPLQDPARLLPALMLLAVFALTAVLAVLATRIGSSQRRDRLGRLRLMGASARQVRLIALFERLAPIVAGLVVGGSIFYASRPALAKAWIGDGTFFVSDVTPRVGPWVAAVVLIGALGAISTQAETRRIIADPTGSVRGAEGPLRWRLRAWTAAVLVAALFAMSAASSSGSALGRAPTLLLTSAAALCVVLLIGPELVRRLGARLRSGGGAVRLVAGRRQEGNPRAVFRATAGVAVAVVISTAYAAVAPSAYAQLSDERVIGQQSGTAQIDVSDATPAQTDGLLARLADLNGIESIAPVSRAMTSSQGSPNAVWIGNCTDIAAAARLTGLPCGQAPVLVAGNRLEAGFDPLRPFEIYDFRPADTVGRNNETLYGSSGSQVLSFPSVAEMPTNTAVDSPDVIIDRAAPGGDVPGLRPSMLLISHNAELDIETLRTLAYQMVPNAQIATRATSYDGFNLELRTVRDLVQALSFTLYALAGLSIVIAANASVIERREAFLALLSAGAPRSSILRTILLESATPVLLTGLIAGLVGGTVAASLSDGSFPLGTLALQAVLGVILAIVMSSVALLPAYRLTTAVEGRRR